MQRVLPIRVCFRDRFVLEFDLCAAESSLAGVITPRSRDRAFCQLFGPSWWTSHGSLLLRRITASAWGSFSTDAWQSVALLPELVPAFLPAIPPGAERSFFSEFVLALSGGTSFPVRRSRAQGIRVLLERNPPKRSFVPGGAAAFS
jgi:hypothetical protein